jgi:hypothetical protein
MRRSLWVALWVAFVACGGSQTKPASKPEAAEPAAPPAAPKASLAVLPVTKGKYPKLAAALDDALRGANVADATPKMLGVTIDVIQLQIECVEPTPACYAAVAKSLGVDQLLFARVDPVARGEVRVEIRRTDASGATVGMSGGTFPNEEKAIGEAQGLVTFALGARSAQ